MNLDATVSDLTKPLLRYCRGRSGDPGLAEDAAQEALMALVGRWRKLGPPESPSAFVFTVARRRLDRRRTRQRLMAPLELVMGRMSSEESPADRLAVRQELRSTVAAVERLKPKLREALLLVSTGELDTATAAQVLGISTSALKMRVARARAQIQGELKEADNA